MSSCLSEIDDEVLDEAAGELYYALNRFMFPDVDMRNTLPFPLTPVPTQEAYRGLSLVVIESLRKNFE